MTLALALIDNGEVFLMADTQLTLPTHKEGRPFYGLKIFFLDKFTAVAYAGTAGEVAHSRLFSILQMKGTEDIRHLAEKISKHFDSQVDFLLAKSGPSPTIAKVSEGMVASSSTGGLFWIGDTAAANFVTRGVAAPEGYRLQDRMEEAIASPCFSTVGGHVVTAKGCAMGFRFVPYMKLVSPMYAPEEGWQSVNFGNAEMGGFGYTTVTPREIGVNGWGVYYFQGKFGKYFRVDLENNIGEILKAHADNVEQFIDVLETEIGVQLEHCGSLG